MIVPVWVTDWVFLRRMLPRASGLHPTRVRGATCWCNPHQPECELQSFFYFVCMHVFLFTLVRAVRMDGCAVAHFFAFLCGLRVLKLNGHTLRFVHIGLWHGSAVVEVLLGSPWRADLLTRGSIPDDSRAKTRIR